MKPSLPRQSNEGTPNGTVMPVSGRTLGPCYQQVRACAAATVNVDLPFMQVYGEPRLSLLGDSTRQAIFELLARQPCSVGELAEQLPVSRPAVSHHLRVLKDGGLVVSRSDGTRRVYQLDPEGVEALRAYLDRVWAKAHRSVHGAAEPAAADFGRDRRSSSSPASLPLSQIAAAARASAGTNAGPIANTGQ